MHWYPLPCPLTLQSWPARHLIKNGMATHCLIRHLLSRRSVFPYTLPAPSQEAWRTFIHLITPIIQTITLQCWADRFWRRRLHLQLTSHQCLNSRPLRLVVRLLEASRLLSLTEEQQVLQLWDSERENTRLRSPIFHPPTELFDTSVPYLYFRPSLYVPFYWRWT